MYTHRLNTKSKVYNICIEISEYTMLPLKISNEQLWSLNKAVLSVTAAHILFKFVPRVTQENPYKFYGYFILRWCWV